MNLLNNFLEHFIRIFCDFWLSSSTITNTEYTIATSSSLSGTADICEDKPLRGTTVLTSASAMTSAINEVDRKSYDINATEAYIESMNMEELNELVNKLEDLELENHKTLTKTINKNYHI